MDEAIFGTDINKGLTSDEVALRTKQGLNNTSRTKTSKTYAQILLGNLFTWFNLICFVLAGALIAVGNYTNLLFMAVFMANLLIGIIQEIKAKRMVDKISVIVETKDTVVRDGKKIDIPTASIVQGDLIIFEIGDQICADCIVASGSIDVNESMLTGESKPIKKMPGDKLLGGSFVVSGTCKAVAEKVGLNTYSSTLVKKARQIKPNQSDILKTLNIIIKTIGIIIIPLGILTFINSYASNDLATSITKTTASIIGMMPVGMFLLTSVSLVVGVLNLARKKTLVQDLYCIEMLARANVLCLDKTGTLTDGTMTVKNVLPINEGYDINTIMASFVLATKTSNMTNECLKKYFCAEQNYKNHKATSLLEFSSDRKFSAASLIELGTFMLGAPEFVTSNLSSKHKQTIKALTQDGLRVLVLCASNEKTCSENMSKNNTPICLVAIEDTIRPDAKDTIAWFNDNGVEVKVISGDNVDTVSNICRKVGIANYDKCISLENMTDEEVENCATKYNVFGRVTPEQKCLLIRAIRKSGKKVAMTGDGVNDILAFKESDCSIAMASGAEATRSASNIIMLDNNFASMPSIVSEGRRVINNISKASSLFLTKTFFTMFLTIFVLISRTGTYPLDPNQIIMWETFFIGVPAFLLALQPNNQSVRGSFLASLSSKALPGALVIFLSAIACYIYCNLTGNLDLIPTLISYTATFGASVILLNQCLPFDVFKTFVFFSMVGACLLALSLLPKAIFNYLPITFGEISFIMIAVVAIGVLYPVLKVLFEILFGYKKRKGQPAKN